MSNDYYHLSLKQDGRTIVATWPFSHIVSQEENCPFREDCQRLASEATCPVILDLSVVDATDGTFFRNILELEEGLNAKGLSLTVRFHATVLAVVRIVKLERLIQDK